MATNMFSGLVRAEVRKARQVLAELQIPAVKAGRSKEEAESLKSSYPSAPAKASWAEVKARREAEYRIANGKGSGNEYLNPTEWAEWKELISLIPSTIRVGGGLYRNLKVRKDTLVSLRTSLATAKKAEAETLTRLANEFFNACVEAGVDVLAPDFETSELSLRAQKMAVAESRRVFVYSLKLAEKARLESAGYEVWLDAGLCVANGSIQTREASAQSATRKGRYAHLKAATKYTEESHNWSYAEFAKQAKEVKTLEVIEEKELVATVKEAKTAMRKAEIEYKSVAGKLEYLCAKSSEIETEEEFVSEGYEEQYNILSEEFDLAELGYNQAVKVYNQAVADGGVFKVTVRHMLVVKPLAQVKVPSLAKERRKTKKGKGRKIPKPTFRGHRNRKQSGKGRKNKN